MSVISQVDATIIGLYFLIVLGIGIWVGLRTKTDEDLFLGGRSLTWGVIGCSLFASNISSTTLIGLTGAAYETGIAVSNYEWLAGVPLVLMAAVFIPIYLKSKISTIPEYLELRFDRRSRVTFSLITIVISVIVDMAGGLYAGAIVLKIFFPDLVIWHTTLVLAVIAGFYTAFGGLKAVVYTDTLQAIILILGCTLLSYTLFKDLGFSWSAMTNELAPGHLSVVKPMDDPTLPWLGTLVGVPLLGFWYWVTNQYVAQRVLAAKDVNHARWGAMLGGFLKLLPVFIMVLPGVMAIKLLPGIETPDQVFPLLVTEVLPVGVVGIVLAGLISAIMSTVDSTLNSASTLIMVDFVKHKKPNLPPAKVAYYGRITTVILMLVAALWAPMIGNFGGLWAYLQQMFAIVVPPIACLFLLGVFYRSGTASAAFVSLIAGIGVGLLIFILGQAGIWTIHFSINVAIQFAFSVAVFVMVSLKTKSTTSNLVLDDLVYHKGIAQPHSTGILRDYRVHSGLLIFCMGLILIFFW